LATGRDGSGSGAGVPSSGTNDVVKVKAHDGAGTLAAKLNLTLPGGYTNEPLTVDLADTSGPLASQSVTLLSPVGHSGTKWKMKTKRDGIQKVMLKGIKSAPDQFQLKVKAKHFFAAANDTPANTRLTVTLGGRCFAHAATKVTP